MTTIDVTTAPRPQTGGTRLTWGLANVLTITWRNLMAILRIPELLFFSTLQPVMFVLLFRYIFAGAIGAGGHVNYVDYLIPGVFVQTVCFGAVSTAIGLADDLQKGLIERFRALPMAPIAVLAGRTVADVCRNVVVIAIMLVVGIAVGFRPNNYGFKFALAIVLMLVFAFALSWGFAYLGLRAPSSETAQVMAFPILFPLTFASSVFVPVATMPSWLQGFAANQPVSQVANGVRYLMLARPGRLSPHYFQHNVVMGFVWSFGILLVMAPIAVRRFRNTI